MKASVLETGGKLELQTLKIPVPKAGEMLMRVKACGVCHTDLHVIKSEIPFPVPAVMGHEVSGEVVSLGPGASQADQSRFSPGTKVAAAFIMPCLDCGFCHKGKEEMCEKFFSYNRGAGQLYDGFTRLFRAEDDAPVAMYSMGGLAEFCVVPTSAVSPLLPGLPFAESCILGCAFFTAFGALKNSAKIQKGETLAVFGTGGIGSCLIQIARAMGVSTVIAVDISDEKLKKMSQLGATHIVNVNNVSALAAIQEITAGHGVDVVVEALGSVGTFQDAVMAVKDGGRAVMVGIAPLGVKAEVPITHIVRRQITIQGSYGARASTDLSALMDLVSKGLIDLTAPVTRTFTLEEADLAYRQLDQGLITGRAIVVMH